MTKPVESVTGTVRMADGTERTAYRNTYNVVVFTADGTSAKTVQDVRIEFELFVNANTSGRKFRKTTPKQAETFKVA